MIELIIFWSLWKIWEAKNELSSKTKRKIQNYRKNHTFCLIQRGTKVQFTRQNINIDLNNNFLKFSKNFRGKKWISNGKFDILSNSYLCWYFVFIFYLPTFDLESILATIALFWSNFEKIICPFLTATVDYYLCYFMLIFSVNILFNSTLN